LDDAWQEARDIIAEWVNEDQTTRPDAPISFIEGCLQVKGSSRKKGLMGSVQGLLRLARGLSTRAPVSQDSGYDGGEKTRTSYPAGLPSCRMKALEILDGLFVKGEGPASQQVRMSVHDSIQEITLSFHGDRDSPRNEKTGGRGGDTRSSSKTFRQLLLVPPLGQKNVLAIDPGFRTGCKVVCLTARENCCIPKTIYPLQSEKGASRTQGQRSLGCASGSS